MGSVQVVGCTSYYDYVWRKQEPCLCDNGAKTLDIKWIEVKLSRNRLAFSDTKMCSQMIRNKEKPWNMWMKIFFIYILKGELNVGFCLQWKILICFVSLACLYFFTEKTFHKYIEFIIGLMDRNNEILKKDSI